MIYPILYTSNVYETLLPVFLQYYTIYVSIKQKIYQYEKEYILQLFSRSFFQSEQQNKIVIEYNIVTYRWT